jgi:Fic family protein
MAYPLLWSCVKMVYRQDPGKYIKNTVTGEPVHAFVPATLPPDPPLQMECIYPLLDQANIAIGRLDGISITVPDPSLFLYMYVRKEAVLSSQIEGTQSTLSDLLMYENEEAVGVPINDVIEVSNYVAAMEHGLRRIKEDFPLSLRLIKEMHEILLQKGRGAMKQPGEFRKSQNWIGGTRPGNATFVPPPQEYVPDLLSNLEKFLHDEKGKMPILIKAALAHVQFETIHPFLDGNGRLGRLLITFILCVDGILREPLLYLSLYFKKNKKDYYNQLQHVRETGDWEEWLQFFLKGIIETANQAVETVQNILKLLSTDRNKIENLGRAAASVLIVHQYMQKAPITDSKKIEKNCDLTLPTVNLALKHLLKLNIVTEITGHLRNKIYVYSQYLKIMSDGIEPN